jgi:hypothetical protein
MTDRDESDFIGLPVVIHPMEESSFHHLDGCIGRIVKTNGDHALVKVEIPNYPPFSCPTIGIRLDRLDFEPGS